MGVKGLWQLLDSTGSPVTLESLENKVLGVDISIWLNQAIKGYRDKDGQPIHNAHLLGLFQRVSKLLFYRIKPVFVFDGGVPYLKKQTLLARNLQKKKAREESSKVGKQILSNYLTSHVIGKQLNENSPDEHILNLISPKKTRMQEDDLFHLPSTSISNLVTSSDSEDSWEQIEQYRSAVFGSEYQNLNDIDVDGSDFKNLPLEIRYEVLKEMKEVKKNRDLSGKQDLPEVAEDFSEFQLKKLIKKRRLQREIEIVQTEMKIQSSGEAFSQLSQDNVNCGSSNYVSQSSRVASDELTHIILLGKNKEVKKDNKTEDIKHMKSEKIIGHRYEIENRAKVLKSSIDFKDMEILIGSDNDELTVSEFQNETSEGAGNQMSESSDADEDDENHKLLLNSEKKAPFETKRNISSSDENELDLPKKKIMKTDGMTPEFTMNSSNNSIMGDKNPNDKISNQDYSISRTATKEGDEPGIIESSDSDSEDFIEVENEKNQEMSLVQLPLEDDQNFPEIKNSKSVAGSSNDESQVTKDSNEVLEVEPRTDQSVDLELKKANAEAENVVLLEERARQERIAVSITDNMVTECQGDLKLKKANAEAENVVLLEERARQERIAVSVTDNMVTECQELLKLFGVPFIVSPMEAEAQCAKLDELQLTDGTISDDSDIWLFGGRYVYKNFFNQKRHVEGYKLADIESLLVDGKDRNIIQNLYWNQAARVRVGDTLSDKVQIERGVRQGCIMSPTLFGRYTEDIFKKATCKMGIKVNGRIVNNLRYADDTALIAENENDLQHMIDIVNDIGEDLNMRVNTKKTKYMVVGKDDAHKQTNIKVNGVALEENDSIVYLGQLFTKDGKCEDEIKRRIQIARNTFSKMNAIFKDQHLRLSTKLRVVRCYVIARLLYGAETWTLNETMEKRIRSLEMWFYRRILKIVWTDKISNKEVIKRIVDRGGWQLEIMKNIKRRKMQYCGHIIRAEGLQSSIMLGRLEGKRSRGRPRKRWLDDVTKWGRFTKVSSLVTTAKNRVKWKSVVHATLQMEDAT
ncbi:DNA repair protein complementing XP-G cells [Nymphon striatum]|nr:DNA repair protein complementing XP-G cells [Nymphon striatum]